ncbi:MAG: GGDEF domain-containing protein [Lachnospiraceae bacterium]
MNLQQLFYSLYFEINLFGAVIMLVLFCRLITNNRFRGQAAFRRLLIWQGVLFFSDALSRITQDYQAGITDILVMIFKSVYFTSSIGMSCEYFIYFEYCRNSKVRQNPKLAHLIRIPLYVYAGLIVLNFPGGFLFYMDKQGVYHRGPVFALAHIVCFAYSFVSTVRSLRDAFRKENYADRTDYLNYALFPVLPVLAGLFQYFIPNIPALCPILSILSIIIYINAMDQLIFTDPLTGLQNRRSLLHDMMTKMKTKREGESFFFVMIDLNDFKSINDRHGHNAGDQALTILADAMSKMADKNRKNMILGRYGGDEFAVAITAKSLQEVETYLNQVRSEVSVLSSERALPCEISFSAGVAMWNGTDDPGKLIARADQDMYHLKAEYKKRR